MGRQITSNDFPLIDIPDGAKITAIERTIFGWRFEMRIGITDTFIKTSTGICEPVEDLLHDG